MTFLVELGLAVVSILISTAISEQQTMNAEGRAAHETKIRKLFQAVKDRYGITLNQLDQALSKLDLQLSQLTEATRGSARLSRASKIMREFIQAYPEKVGTINNAKNAINNAINNLTAKEAQAASKIQSRGSVNQLDVLKDVQPEADAVNLVITDTNKKLGNENNEEKVNNIDTQLVEEKPNESESSKKDAQSPYSFTGIQI